MCCDGYVGGQRSRPCLRGHRQARLDRRRRAVHPDVEDAPPLPSPRAVPAGELSAGTRCHRPVVQHAPSPHAARREDARRGVLRHVSRQPPAAVRAPRPLAPRVALRPAVGLGAGHAGRGTDDRSPLPARPKAPAHPERQASACRLSRAATATDAALPVRARLSRMRLLLPSCQRTPRRSTESSTERASPRSLGPPICRRFWWFAGPSLRL